ncbi:MAG: histidinol-phosphatase [Bacteroidota bacterium]
MQAQTFYSFFFWSILSFFLGSWFPSHAQGGKWLKGNLHTHTLWSDGDEFPDRVALWYKTHGYDFLAISDHNTLNEGEKWVVFLKGTRQEKIFLEYLKDFGDEWVEYEEKAESWEVKLKTFAEYKRLIGDPEKFLLIPSEEITDSFEGRPVHLNATNIQEVIKPLGGQSTTAMIQRQIDAVHQQAIRKGRPMLPHVCHPNFGWAITAEDMKPLENLRLFEIYNGHPLVQNEGNFRHPSTDFIWDEVLTHFVLEGKGPLYGLAVDDSHNFHRLGVEFSNAGRGWVWVKAKALETSAILEALEAGDFYATNGPKLSKVKRKRKKLKLEIEPEEGVKYKIRFIVSTNKERGKIAQEIEGLKATYKLKPGELYVRAIIFSDKGTEFPYRKGEKGQAWTQPVIRK